MARILFDQHEHCQGPKEARKRDDDDRDSGPPSDDEDDNFGSPNEDRDDEDTTMICRRIEAEETLEEDIQGKAGLLIET
jgi:hypothetical protein